MVLICMSSCGSRDVVFGLGSAICLVMISTGTDDLNKDRINGVRILGMQFKVALW